MMAASNDITGDPIQTPPPSQAYRDGYDRIFSKQQQQQQPVPKARQMRAEDIKRQYTNIGTANSAAFNIPQGRWVRFKMNRRGTYELFCCHETREYYDVYSD